MTLVLPSDRAVYGTMTTQRSTDALSDTLDTLFYRFVLGAHSDNEARHNMRRLSAWATKTGDHAPFLRQVKALGAVPDAPESDPDRF